MKEFYNKIALLKSDFFGDNCTELTKALVLEEESENITRAKSKVLNWIGQETKKPRGFIDNYHKLPISQIRFKTSNEQVFPLEAFKDWKLETFMERLKKYKNDLDYIEKIMSFKYLCFFSQKINAVLYFTLNYIENNEGFSIELLDSNLNSKYSGILIFNQEDNIIQIVDKSLPKQIICNFIFDKSSSKLFGLGLFHSNIQESVEAKTCILLKEQIDLNHMSLNFLSSINQISLVEAKISASEFKKALYKYIGKVEKYIELNPHNGLHFQNFIYSFKDIYNNLKLFNDSGKYFITDIQTTIESSINLFSKYTDKEKREINLLIDINDRNIDFNYIKTLLLSFQEGFISLNLIILIESDFQLAYQDEKSFREIEAKGVNLFFLDKSKSLYSFIFFFHSDITFAIYKESFVKGYKVINLTNTIKKLNDFYHQKIKESLNIDELIKQKYPLNGIWHFDGYGSNDVLHHVIFNIKNTKIDLTLKRKEVLKEYSGDVFYNLNEYTILSTGLGIFHLKNSEPNSIKIASLVSDQYKTGTPTDNRGGVILFGLFSRQEIEENDLVDFFAKIISKENSPYEKASFKISLNISEAFKELRIKYEES